MPLQPLSFSKTCPMKPVWVLSCCSGSWENCASAISARRWMSPSPRSPSSGNAPGKRSIAGSQAGEMGSLSLIPAYSFRAAQVIEQARLSQQDDVQAIARKLASANCSGSGKAVCI